MHYCCYFNLIHFSGLNIKLLSSLDCNFITMCLYTVFKVLLQFKIHLLEYVTLNYLSVYKKILNNYLLKCLSISFSLSLFSWEFNSTYVLSFYHISYACLTSSFFSVNIFFWPVSFTNPLFVTNKLKYEFSHLVIYLSFRFSIFLIAYMN